MHKFYTQVPLRQMSTLYAFLSKEFKKMTPQPWWTSRTKTQPGRVTNKRKYDHEHPTYISSSGCKRIFEIEPHSLPVEQLLSW